MTYLKIFYANKQTKKKFKMVSLKLSEDRGNQVQLTENIFPSQKDCNARWGGKILGTCCVTLNLN